MWGVSVDEQLCLQYRLDHWICQINGSGKCFCGTYFCIWQMHMSFTGKTVSGKVKKGGTPEKYTLTHKQFLENLFIQINWADKYSNLDYHHWCSSISFIPSVDSVKKRTPKSSILKIIKNRRQKNERLSSYKVFENFINQVPTLSELYTSKVLPKFLIHNSTHISCPRLGYHYSNAYGFSECWTHHLE